VATGHGTPTVSVCRPGSKCAAAKLESGEGCSCKDGGRRKGLVRDHIYSVCGSKRRNNCNVLVSSHMLATEMQFVGLKIDELNISSLFQAPKQRFCGNHTHTSKWAKQPWGIYFGIWDASATKEREQHQAHIWSLESYQIKYVLGCCHEGVTSTKEFRTYGVRLSLPFLLICLIVLMPLMKKVIKGKWGIIVR
jgi:hypothetical protein